MQLRTVDVSGYDPGDLLKSLLDGDGRACLKLGSDHIWLHGRGAIVHNLAIACMVRVSGGLGAVSADSPPDGMREAHTKNYGEFSASYDLEHWYARFGGERRRIMAHLCPSLEECLARCPMLPPGYVAPKTWADIEKLQRPNPAPYPNRKLRVKEASGQSMLF